MKTMRIGTLAAAFLAIALLFAVYQQPHAQTGGGQALSTEQLDKHIRDYILNNPEIVVQAIQKWQALQQQAELQKFTKVLQERRDEIFNDPSAPIGGDPDGDVTVVEFMDYNCAYCRKVFPAVSQLSMGNSKVRLLFKEFPILGPGSEFASSAALASRNQGLYMDFHNALMLSDQRLEEPQVLAIAERVGLDIEQLKKDMKDPEIQAAIDRNFDLAKALAINGTPGFVIGDEIVRGATSLENLQLLIERARQAP